MKRVQCIVEGQTEAKVFSTLLAPYIFSKTNTYINFTPVKHSGGGIVPYSKLFVELRNHLRDKDKILTTFFDYYGITQRLNFPNFKEAKIDQKSSRIGVAILEHGIKDDLEKNGLNTENFIPYIQLHEFEALLFSSDDGFDFQYDNAKMLHELKSIAPRYQSPEEINDDPITAPSKRIINILNKYNEKYEKVVDGEAIASTIGIQTMMSRCPRFMDWVNRLITKINS